MSSSAGGIDVGYPIVQNSMSSRGVSEAYEMSRENARKRFENSAERFEVVDPPETIGVRTFYAILVMFGFGWV